jgi:hypothetical protein
MARKTLVVVNGVLLHLHISEIDVVNSFLQRLDFTDGISK